MKRVLFVDQDRRVADGLQQLVSGDDAWSITVAGDDDAALALLELERFDVVVSELRSPRIDGPALLKRAQELHPTATRIVLSGNTTANGSSGLRAVPVAHQFLTKPFNPAELRNVIVRACNLQELLDSETLRGVIGELSSLPSVPRLFTDLQHKLDDPDAGAREIAAIIEQDPAMSAKVLQISNSAMFNVGRAVVNVRDAVSLLGFSTIRNLVLTFGVFHSFSDYGRGLGLWIESLQNHSLQTAQIAAHMFSADRRRADDAFMAAVLHDAGKLVLATQRPQYLREVLAVVRAQRCPMFEVETELAGITHAEIGGYLLGLWGLPQPIVEAVANHHAPQRVEQTRFDLLAAVHIANVLAQPTPRSIGTAPLQRREELDPHYLEALGVADQLPAWREFADRATGSKLVKV